MAGPWAPGVAELGRPGVARVSLGSGVAQSAYAATSLAARQRHITGDYHPLVVALSFPDLVACSRGSRQETTGDEKG
ncbi:hypothetical protein STENM223S_01853 [Streptomyces tendae]